MTAPTYSDLLVHIEGTDRDDGCLGYAAALAAAHGAHLTGLHVVTPFQVPGTFPGYVFDQIREIQDARAAEAGARAKAAFEAAVEKAGVPGELHTEDGPIDEVVGTRALYHDLAVVGQHDPDRDEAPDRAHLAERLLVHWRCPVVVVPYVGAPPAAPRRIAVAWNASPEAARAVAGAMPLLVAADEVRVLAVNPSHIGDLPGADIAAHLARHGATVHTDRIDTDVAPAPIEVDPQGPLNRHVMHMAGDTIPVAEAILSFIAAAPIDMLVMGAFGHSQFREALLGGASRHILRQMTVPVLMAH